MKDASSTLGKAFPIVPGTMIRDGEEYTVLPKEYYFGLAHQTNEQDELPQDPRHPEWDAAFSRNTDFDHQTSADDVVPEKFHVVGTQEEKEKLLALLNEFADVFTTELPSECCDATPLEIKLKDEAAWEDESRNRQQCRPQSEAKNAAIKEYVDEGAAKGLVRRERKPTKGWAQIVMVPKKTEEWRVCIDYDPVNRHSEKSLYPIPLISELLREAATHRPRRFATLDLTSGFHQLKLSEAAIMLTAFICWLGVFCYLRAPMGLKYLPGIFQCTMETEIFVDLVHMIMLIYIDDVLTWGTDFKDGRPIDPIDDLIANLRVILQRARDKRVKFNPNKSKFGLYEIEYVGHLIDSVGITFSPEKLTDVQNFQEPRTKGLLKTFLGLANYFRDNVDGYVYLAEPFQKLSTPYTKQRKGDQIEWTPELSESFTLIKNAIVNCVKIAHRRPGAELHLHVDASDYGHGAALSQVWKEFLKDSEIRHEEIIGLISRTFTPAQRNWDTPNKEAYGAYFPFVHWRPLLSESFFLLFTDHANLLHVSLDSNPRVVRWRIFMQDFDFAMVFKKGCDNKVADPMSRLCRERYEDEPTTLESLAAYMGLDDQFATAKQNDNDPLDSESTACDFDGTFLGSLQEQREFVRNNLEKVEEIPQYWVDKAQNKSLRDERITEIHNLHTTVAAAAESVHSLTECFATTEYEVDSVKRGIIDKCHNAMVGHWGVDRTISLILKLRKAEPDLIPSDDTWDNIRQDVKHVVSHCAICQKLKYHRLVTETRKYTTSTYGIMENLSIDGISMPHSSAEGHTWVIVIIDSFSRMIQVYPTKDCSAASAVECLIKWMSIFGIPEHIRTDNSTQFAGKYAEILSLLKIQQHFIQAYSHEENGTVESANREILRHLRALLLANRSTEWHVMMYVAARIMNSRVIKATGISPQDLVFAGRLDLNRGALFPREIQESQSISDYMRISMESQEAMLRVAIEQQRETDLAHLKPNSRILPTMFDVGTYVLAKRETPDKLRATWMGPYRITHRTVRSEGDVYTVCDDNINKSYDFQVRFIKPFIYDENDPDPTEVLHYDHQSYEIEAVTQHRFTGSQKSAATLQLLIKWKGYAKLDWQTFSTDIRKVQIVHNYLRANKMSKFIPQQFK
jgi:hypothetical protein